LTGDPDECGDTGVIKVYDNFCFMSLVNVLRNGKPAAQVALSAKEYLAHNYTKQLKTNFYKSPFLWQIPRRKKQPLPGKTISGNG